jgi:surface antigen
MERFFLTAFRKRSFFGLGTFVRENGSLVVIVVIATLIVFGNISADDNYSDSFLVGYWSDQTTSVQSVYKSDDSIILDGGVLHDTQNAITSSEEKEKVSEQVQLDVLANADEELLGDSAIIPPRREGASDPENEGDVILYTVMAGDTLSTIAQKHSVTTATLFWANEIEDVDDIKPGDTIFILPVSGIKHKVKSGDTIDAIAKEYDVDEKEIIAYNSLPANGELKTDQEIIIPGAHKDIPEPEPLFTPRDYVATGTGSTNLGSAIVGNTAKTRKAGNSFPYGYCTYYVANKRTVTWRGNAGAWLYNAKAQGYSTGKKPKAGAIVVTTEDARYGHVAYVESVGKDTITISEMNYKGWGVVNTRTLSQNARVIRGYIY